MNPAESNASEKKEVHQVHIAAIFSCKKLLPLVVSRKKTLHSPEVLGMQMVFIYKIKYRACHFFLSGTGFLFYAPLTTHSKLTANALSISFTG